MFKGFCYFIPGPRNRPKAQIQHELSLPVIGQPETRISIRGCQAPEGTSEGQGVLVWPGEAAGNNWRPEPGQLWKRIAPEVSGAATEYFLGFYPQAKPVPQDLLRPRTVRGEKVRIAGSEWLVPVALHLPKVFALNGDGRIEHDRVCEEYRALWALAEQYFNWKFQLADAPPTKTHTELFSLAAKALNVNYHVGVYELAALEIFDTENTIAVLDTLVDAGSLIEEAKRYEAAQKKTGTRA